MKDIEITLDGVPEMPNRIDGRHWKSKWIHNKKWKSLIYQSISPYIPQTPYKKVELECIRETSRQPDFDNLAKSFKPLIDGLVQAGFILDDNPGIIGQPTYSWRKGKPRFKKTIIRIKIIA